MCHFTKVLNAKTRQVSFSFGGKIREFFPCSCPNYLPNRDASDCVPFCCRRAERRAPARQDGSSTRRSGDRRSISALSCSILQTRGTHLSGVLCAHGETAFSSGWHGAR